MSAPHSPVARSKHWAGRTVLIVSPTPTHPQDYGNRKRIYRICKMLQNAGAKIHYLHYASEAEWRNTVPVAAQTAMMQEWDGYYLVTPTRGLHDSPAGTHHEIDEWWDEHIGTTLHWLGEKLKPDAVIVNYTWLSRALDYLPEGILKILDTHDKFSGRKEMLASYGIGPEFFYTTEAEETKALNRADVVWAIKEEERLLFQKMTSTPVITVPHADPFAPISRRAAGDPDELRIGVMGAQNSINYQNLMRFIEAARPVFKEHLAPVKLVIGGTICEKLDHLDLPFVEKIGWVENVEEFYEQIDVALVPMEFSTGLKIKTSEALTFDMPLVSHAHAFEGYAPFHDFHMLPSFKAIAEACVDLSVEPIELARLKTATKASHQAAVKAIEAGVNATGERLRGAKAFTLICVSPKAMEKGTLSQASLRSYLEYLSYRGPVALYVDACNDENGLLRFCMGCTVARVHINPAIRAQLTPEKVALIEGAGGRWSSFADMFKRSAVKQVWLNHVPEDASSLEDVEVERVYVNVPMMQNGKGRAHLEAALDAMTGAFSVVTAIAPGDMPLASHLRHKYAAELVRTPPFWPRNFPALWDLTPPPPEDCYGVNLLLPHRSDAIVETISRVAQLAGQPLINIITMDEREGPMERIYKNGMDYRYLTVEAAEGNARGLLRNASVTISFASEDPFGRKLLTVLNGAGHLIMEPAKPMLTNSTRTRQFTKPRRLGLWPFMKELHAVLTEPRAQIALGPLMAAQFENDAGWTKIWGHGG